MVSIRRLDGAAKSILLAAIAVVVLIITTARAAPAAVLQRVEFSKEASKTAPHVGETFSFTLRFNTVPAEDETLWVRVTDPNPAPAYLEIVTDSITGGATYNPAIDAVVWQGTLDPGGAQPKVVAFQVRTTGIPAAALAAGYLVTNTATMADLATPGSLPEVIAESAIRIMPYRLFLPAVFKNDTG